MAGVGRQVWSAFCGHSGIVDDFLSGRSGGDYGIQVRYQGYIIRASDLDQSIRHIKDMSGVGRQVWSAFCGHSGIVGDFLSGRSGDDYGIQVRYQGYIIRTSDLDQSIRHIKDMAGVARQVRSLCTTIVRIDFVCFPAGGVLKTDQKPSFQFLTGMLCYHSLL